MDVLETLWNLVNCHQRTVIHVTARCLLFGFVSNGTITTTITTFEINLAIANERDRVHPLKKVALHNCRAHTEHGSRLCSHHFCPYFCSQGGGGSKIEKCSECDGKTKIQVGYG